MTAWVIEAENVRKTFAWTPVLHGVSCQIGGGEIVSIFGPNGAGKTTFLRILATLLHGAGADQFGLLGGLALGPQGSIWVADAGNARVMEFVVPAPSE